MFTIGLTGGIASGKTTVCGYFTELGIDVFDADSVARELVQINTPCYQKILQQFGPNILLSNQTLDRHKLRGLIFSNTTAKQALENILHPAIHTELVSRSQSSQSAYCILAIPLLSESKLTYPLNRIVVIDATVELQLKRLCIRDSLSIAAALEMIQQQPSRADRVAISDDVIHNNSELALLKNQVSSLHHRYLQLAKLASVVAS